MSDLPEVSEGPSLAAEMFTSYRKMVEFYASQKGFAPDDPERVLTLAEADAQARDAGDVTRLRERMLTAEPSQISWWGLSRLAEHDPDAAHAAWERVKAAARQEIDNGHRAASVMQGYAQGEPADRARFIALRTALVQTWQPRNAVEQLLVDTLAQCHAAYEFWLSAMMSRATIEAQAESRDVNMGKGWRLPAATDVQAIEQAAGMVDRFNRLAIRTLRALRDLRRYTPPVTIQQAGQVNIGAQQINVTDAPGGA